MRRQSFLHAKADSLPHPSILSYGHRANVRERLAGCSACDCLSFTLRSLEKAPCAIAESTVEVKLVVHCKKISELRLLTLR